MNYTNGIYLLLGTNLGDKIMNLKKAILLLKNSNIQIVAQSKVYVSPSWGYDSINDYYNIAIEVSANFDPYSLLDLLKTIEKSMGRSLTEKGYADRIIDIDILYHRNTILNALNLIVPHPKLSERRFALMPLAEIAPNFIHPLFQISTLEMLKNCKDSALVEVGFYLSE